MVRIDFQVEEQVMGESAEKTLVRSSAASPTWLRVGFWGCTVIAIVVVLRRVMALISPTRVPPQMAGLDGAFASHMALTLAHILPALTFVLIAPLVVFRRFEHVRWAEGFVYPLGVLVGLTAYAMSTFAVGGWVERSAVLVFDTLFLFSLLRSYLYGREGDAVRKRRWLLRAIAVLLGISTTRPVMGMFFATAMKTHLRVEQFFGIAFWIGFSINVLIFEVWIRARDRRLEADAARG
jgi:hypothetical protein